MSNQDDPEIGDARVERLRETVREYIIKHPEKQIGECFEWAAKLASKQGGAPISLQAIVPRGQELITLDLIRKGAPPDAAANVAEDFESRALEALEESRGPWWRRLWRKVVTR